ncbi:alcohol dehydrogenase catalytic domain-containing protein [Mycobacterium sp. 21AC1]|uniref:zinc-dependent alcohol dehydrogenase n=1 Tax=[Mycobacterium] appelbergii TaxID=2939269 RepID=UPI002939076B|nr:alcohol dehydrogenase catalytic domain-containing protein [Mycobacterium sp. 21AC1]MDV3124222.1 alcohol dehydrogenase catalytic domain-containing protein [Mycobacterium sp. 21AC1]
MKAAVLTATRHVEVRDIADPEPCRDEIVIAVEASGICGSDLHAWHGRHPFRQPPVVLGHEPAGTVVARGSDVATVELGDRVVIEPHRICGACDACRRGDNELCEYKQYPATHGWHGSLADFFAAPANMVHPVPDGLPLELAALAEPLAVACHANRRGQTGPGMTVNIVGSGTIGLLCTMVARHLGAQVDVVTDIDAEKLGVAAELGARRPSDVRTSDIVEELRASRFERADTTIVAATAPQSLVDGAALTRPGGRIVLLGLYRDTAMIAASSMVTDEQTLVGSLTYNSADFDAALSLLAADPESYGRFITKRVGLHEVGAEFTRQSEGGAAIKTLVLPGLTE